jgi:hypothetical protein
MQQSAARKGMKSGVPSDLETKITLVDLLFKVVMWLVFTPTSESFENMIQNHHHQPQQPL